MILFMASLEILFIQYYQPNGDIIIFLLKEIICNNNHERENILIKLIPIDMKIKAQPKSSYLYLKVTYV
jgi:hypothetical protein